MRTNYRRRALGILVCFGPVGLVIASLAVGILFGRRPGTGLALAICALLVALLNAYLSFLRPLRYRRRHGSLEGLRHISVFAGIGTAFVLLAMLLGFGDAYAAGVALLATALDTGGLPWFLVATWSDRSLWDG